MKSLNDNEKRFLEIYYSGEGLSKLEAAKLAGFQCASDTAFNQAAEAALKKQDTLTMICKDYLESMFCKYLPIEQRRLFLDTSDPVRYGAIKLAIDRINDHNIPGALAEVGVYQGHTSKIIHMLAPNRHLFLFDTFEGFPNKDLEGRLDHRFMDTNIDIVKEVIGNMDNIDIRKGYFPETTAGLENEIFAFVMLDVDLYAPTLSGLNFFYNRLSPGGYIFIHDYSDGHEVYKAVNEVMADKPEGIVCLPDTWGSAIICKNRAEGRTWVNKV